MGTVWGWLLLVALVTVVDWVLALRPATLADRPRRGRARPARATTPTSRLTVANPGAGPSGRWSATRGSRPPGPPATGTGSGCAPVTRPCSPPACVPRRRGDLRAVGVTVRIPGPLGPGRAPGDPRRAGHGPLAAAVRVPQAPALAAGPAARARRPLGGPHPRRRHRVRLAARIRPRRRRTLHRLASQRPQPQRRGTHLAARARPPRRHRARHLTGLGRPDRRRAAARLGDGRRAAARRAGGPRG